MADNSILPATGDVIASDDIAGVKYQIVKAAFGPLDSVTLVSTATPLPASPPNATASGTLSASDAVVAAPVGDGTLVSGASTAGSVVYVAVPDGMSSWTLMLKNYTSGTVYTEASNNTTNGTDGDWVEVKGRRTGTAPGVESVSYAMVANGYYRGNTGSFKAVRARLIGATGVTIRWDVSSGTGAVFLNSGLVASGSVIGKVGIDQTTPGVTNAVQVNDVSASGTLTALNDVVPIVISGGGAWAIDLAGFAGHVITFESQVNAAATWRAINGALQGVGTLGSTVSADGTYRGTAAALAGIRARLSTVGTGSVTAYGRAGIGTGGVFQITPTPAGSNVIGKVGIDQTTPGTTNLVSIGTNGTVTVSNPTAQGLTDTQLRATAVPVSGTFFQATQPVSLATNTPDVTDRSARLLGQVTNAGTFAVQAASTLNAETTKVIGTINIAAAQTLAATQSGTWTVQPGNTANSTPWLINAAQIGGVAPLMGNGVTGTGSQRVTLASDNSALPAAGQGAVGAAAPTGATLQGLRAATANPANATAGNMIAGMADKAGRAVMTPVQVRELVTPGTVTVAATTETTLIAAGGAGVFNDIIGLVITTAGAAAQTIAIKDATAGTTRININYPNAALAPGAQFTLMFPAPMPQATANANWTVTQSLATACNYTFLYAKNL